MKEDQSWHRARSESAQQRCRRVARDGAAESEAVPVPFRVGDGVLADDERTKRMRRGDRIHENGGATAVAAMAVDVEQDERKTAVAVTGSGRPWKLRRSGDTGTGLARGRDGDDERRQCRAPPEEERGQGESASVRHGSGQPPTLHIAARTM